MIRRLTTSGYESANGIGRFICDYSTDLADLPTQNPSATYPDFGCVQSGSIAVVVEEACEYILDNQGQWKLYRDGTDDDGNVSKLDYTVIETF